METSQAFQDVFPLPITIRRRLCRRVLFRQPRHDMHDAPGLRVYIVTHIHDRLGAERGQLLRERLIAAPAGRVDDGHSALDGGGEVADVVEDLCAIADAEGDLVRESVKLRVVRGKAYRVGGEFDAGNLGEVRSEGERENAGATVSVYEVGWRWRQDHQEKEIALDLVLLVLVSAS